MGFTWGVFRVLANQREDVKSNILMKIWAQNSISDSFSLNHNLFSSMPTDSRHFCFCLCRSPQLSSVFLFHLLQGETHLGVCIPFWDSGWRTRPKPVWTKLLRGSWMRFMLTCCSFLAANTHTHTHSYTRTDIQDVNPCQPSHGSESESARSLVVSACLWLLSLCLIWSFHACSLLFKLMQIHLALTCCSCSSYTHKHTHTHTCCYSLHLLALSSWCELDIKVQPCYIFHASFYPQNAELINRK